MVHRVPRALVCGCLHAVYYCAMALLLAASQLLCMAAYAAPADELLFYRGAFVLQRIAPQVEWPPVIIPSFVARDDTVSVLLHHSDTVFVITRLAREMDALSINNRAATAEAGRYAAHAYALLGRKAEAATAMRRYTTKNLYSPANYLFATRNFYEAGSYRDMRTVLYEWNKRDPRGICDEKRLKYLWGGYYAEGRHHEAIAALSDSGCKGWRVKLLQAKSLLELDRNAEAEDTVQKALQRNPKIQGTIDTAWHTLRNAGRYP